MPWKTSLVKRIEGNHSFRKGFIFRPYSRRPQYFAGSIPLLLFPATQPLFFLLTTFKITEKHISEHANGHR